MASWNGLSDMYQADFIRNGTAKGIMSMSKENSTQLWNSVLDSGFISLGFLSALLPSLSLTVHRR
jgi:autophagy-related protein 5